MDRPNGASQVLLARVRRTLHERQLLAGARRVLVACSGGPDSQTLLHALSVLRAELGCELLAAAVDHGLRPEARCEIALVAELADALGVPFVALRVEVGSGASLQAQARAARYTALLAYAQANGASRVAVGHTLDDQAETVLARLLRGSSVEGLAAIEPLRADGVARPLIDAPRALVHGYAAELGLVAAQDPSNLDPRYLRVRIRQQLLPVLRAENPRIALALAHLADDAREAGQVLAVQVDEALSQARSNGACMLLERPAPLRRRVLKRWAEDALGCSLRRQHIVALERMLSVGGEVRLPGSVLVRVDEAGQLTFVPVSKRGRGLQRLIEKP